MSDFPDLIQAGGGPAVIFNHGTMMDATMFAPQMDYLASRGFHVVAINSRAHHLKARHTLKDLAEDTLAVADRLGIETFTPVGMSVGAFATIELAAMAPARCNGMVLIDGMACGYTDEERALFESKFAPLDIDGPLPADFADWMVPIIFGRTTIRRNPDLVAHWRRRWTTSTPARAVWSQSTSWTRKVDHTALLSGIKLPTLVIHGEEDAGIQFTSILPMLPELSDLTLLKVAEAGHAANLEKPDIVNGMLDYFLRRIQPE